MLFTSALLMATAFGAHGQGSFCGAVNTPGCDAVKSGSAAIVGWATGCTVVRGPADIAEPSVGYVHFGADSLGIGTAGFVTTNAVSLGDGGSATLTFAAPIRNVEGPDFAVFENPFNDNFLELAFVEVSTDGVRYVRFPAISETQDTVQTGPNGSTDPTRLRNLAGKYRVGYGTPFDLEELRDSAGIDIDSIVYVRVVDVVGCIDPRYATRDARGHIINDPYPTRDMVYGSGGFDLTGVAVLRSTVSVGASAGPSHPLTVWPTPASAKVSVGGLEPGASVRLLDASGRAVWQSKPAGGVTIIDMAGLPDGVYVVRAGERTAKVVKIGQR